MVEFEPARLITRIAESQDRAAFAELFKHYAPRVKAIMMRRGAGPDGPRTWRRRRCSALAKGRAIRSRAANPSAWVYAIARNVTSTWTACGPRIRVLEEKQPVEVPDPAEPEF